MKVGETWVRVKSESELRAGMCVELRTCSWCLKRHRRILTAQLPSSARLHCADGTIRSGKGHVSWDSIPGACPKSKFPNRPFCLDRAIREGRLYRLSDAFLAETKREKAEALR